MYTEKRESKGKIKYFLTHSFREGSKVHKIRKYLGQELSQSKLKERRKIAEELILDEIDKYNLILDPLHAELSKEEIALVKKIEHDEDLKVYHLSKEQWRLFSRIFTYNTNAIEGSLLNRKEVENLLDKGKWPSKSKYDIAEAYGVNEAINHIRKTNEHLSIKLIKELHKIVFKNSKGFAGKFRKKEEEVVIMDSLGHIVHEGAPQSRIKALLEELIKWYESHKKKYPGLILAAVVHNQFENIHPFADGNGRVGRLLLNNILIKHKLPPLNIDLKNRFEYYDTLQEYETKHNLKPTTDLMIKEYKALKKKLR